MRKLVFKGDWSSYFDIVMICHYEVFNLPFSASAEDIKKKYKKLALQYHPGKKDHVLTD